MLQRNGMVMVEMKVLVMMMMVMVMVMMIPMKSSAMVMTMVTISLSGKELLLQISTCRRAFLSRCFPPRRGGGVYL
jgi:hypothetical protein